MTQYTLSSVLDRLASHPNIDMIERVFCATTWAMVDVMQRNGLVRGPLLEISQKAIDRSFVIDTDDLTPLGQVFFRHASAIWMELRVDFATATDQTRYEKPLTKARKEFAKIEAAPAATSGVTTSESTKGTAPPSTSRDGEDEFEKYDDVEWEHETGFVPPDDPDAALTHMALFVAWIVLHDFGGAELLEFAEEVEKLKARTITPREFAQVTLDGSFSSYDVAAALHPFMKSYYLGNGYRKAYGKLCNDTKVAFYAMPDSWASYDRVAAVIDKKYAAWVAKKSKT
jgi:hypothetical protein